jgi:hypothetical protein
MRRGKSDSFILKLSTFQNTMEVNLIKSSGMTKEVFTKVMDLLQSIDGPLKFVCDPASVINFEDDELVVRRFEDPEDFGRKKLPPGYSTLMNYKLKEIPEVNTASWETLFNKCRQYRRQHNIAPNAFVILLTDVSNMYNWFSAANLENPFDGFVHTEDWDYYLDAAAAFPIAYEVLALVLQQSMFQKKGDMKRLVHQRPVGCINDLCMNKQDIILKLRTADICGTCMQALRAAMPDLYIRHALKIMESLRFKMLLSQNFLQNTEPSRLLVDRFNKIRLIDFGNLELQFNATEKALYLFYLRHPDGVSFGALPQHKQEIFELYSSLSNAGMRADMQQRVDTLVAVTGNAASENISRIKRKLIDVLGAEMAIAYCIQGPNGEKKTIPLDRNLVLWDRG